MAEKVVKAPGAGKSVTVEVASGEKLHFAFDIDQAQVDVVGSDMVLTLPDGGQVILLNMAVMLFSGTPLVITTMGGGKMAPDALLGKVGMVQAVTNGQDAGILSSFNGKKAAMDSSETAELSTRPAEPEQHNQDEILKMAARAPLAPPPPSSISMDSGSGGMAGASSRQDIINKKFDELLNSRNKVVSENIGRFREPPAEFRPKEDKGQPPQVKKPEVEARDEPVEKPEEPRSEPPRPEEPQGAAFEFSPGIKLLQLASQQTTEAGRLVVRGGGGAAAAAFDANNVTQLLPEFLDLTQSDAGTPATIHADNPLAFAGNTLARVIQFESTVPDGFRISALVVRGLPDDMAIDGLTADADGSWHIPESMLAGFNGTLPLTLLYQPAAGTAFTLEIASRLSFDLNSGLRPPQLLSYESASQIPVIVRDVSSVTDLVYTENGQRGWVLPTTGNSNIILTGDGDTTVFGGRTADRITSGDGNDRIEAGSGNDTVRTDRGNDTLDGGTGNDILDGGDGIDTLAYSGRSENITVNLDGTVDAEGYRSVQVGSAETDRIKGIENVTGGGGDDILRGDSQNNRLTGNSGDDILHGRGGNDTLEGGSGRDTAVYMDSSTAVTADLRGLDSAATVTAISGSGEIDTLSSIEDVIATLHADTLYGSSAANHLQGLAGDDFLQGGAGDDTLDGGFGEDTLSYTYNTTGVTLDLSLTGTDGYSTAMAGTGDTDQVKDIENVTGGSGNDALYGNALANTLKGGAGSDLLSGGDGNDRLEDGDGNDTLQGGTGNDYFSMSGVAGAGSTSNDTIDGGDGFDTLDYAVLDSTSNMTARMDDSLDGNGYFQITSAISANWDRARGIEKILFGGGNDRMHGNSASNYLDGGAGNDIFRASAGTDTIVGGSGLDEIEFTDEDYWGADRTSRPDPDAIASLTAGTYTFAGSADTSTFTGIERLRGGIGNDTFTGHATADTLEGGAGNDLLHATAGNDSLTGGSGVDTASFALATGSVSASLASGAASDGFGGTDVLTGLENLVGSAHADTLTGDAGTNRLEGGAGNDLLAGGDGNDTLDGGTGTDSASWAGASGGVVWNGAAGTVTETGGTTDILTNIERIAGSGFADTFNATAGNDSVEGGAGDDTFTGSEGIDTLAGGDGLDVLDFSAENRSVVINLMGYDTAGWNKGSFSIADTGQVSTITGIDRVRGGNGNDMLFGSSATETLEGGNGDDALYSSGGNDSIAGGSGLDTINFQYASSGVVVNLASNSVTNDGDGGTDTLSSIESVFGSAFADSITGDANGNLIFAGDGNDTVAGGAGNNLMDGQSGNDTLDYSASVSAISFNLANADSVTGIVTVSMTGQTDSIRGFEKIIGSGLADNMQGHTGNDTFEGGAGDDTLGGGAGDDWLDGGAGEDTVDYSSYSSALTVNLGAVDGAGWATLNLAGGETDRIKSVERFIGTSAADSITGTASADFLSGSAGADTLTGNGGNDSLSGGNDDDLLLGGAGSDTLDGGAGSADVASWADATAGIVWNGSTVTESGGGGTDVLGNIERIIGSGFADTFNTTSADDHVEGGAGNDSFTGSAGADTLDGGAGTDSLSYAGIGSAVTVSLAAGTATGSAIGSQLLNSIENLTGGAFDDILTDSNGNNILGGGDGNDTFLMTGVADTATGGTGNDTVSGENGYDTLSYATVSSTITVDMNALTGGFFTISSAVSANQDQAREIEAITGGSGNDTLYGDGGSNYLDGGGGNDIFRGRGGNDSIVGGSGTDTMSYQEVSTALAINLSVTDGSGFSQAVMAGGETDWLSGVEKVIGSQASDTITGGSGYNYLNGQSGNDTISGMDGNDWLADGAGDDSLLGGNGDDTLEGGSGTDIFDGGSGADTVLFQYVANGVVVNLGAGTVTDAGSGTGNGNDTLVSIERVTGSGFADTLTGSSAADSLDGGAGNDRLNGRAGNDTLTGGAGTDTADYSDAASAVTVNLASGTASDGEGGSDSLSQIENITGSSLNDTLTGDTQGNNLSGGNGNDTLTGGAGADVLNGGAGNDTLNYAAETASIRVNWGDGTVQTDSDSTSDSFSNAETILGGSGGDLFQLDAASLLGTPLYFNGGSGTEQVIVNSGVMGTDASDFASKFDNVEQLRLNGTTQNMGEKLTIDASDILDMTSGNSAKTLTLFVGSGFGLDIQAGSGFSGTGFNGSVVSNGTYTFTNGTDTATLHVQVA